MSGDVVAGSKLALFTDDNSRKAKPTAECVSKSEYQTSNFNVNDPWYWWLADAYASTSCIVRIVDSSGAMNWRSAYYGSRGVRPLCYPKSVILVSIPGEDDEEEQAARREEMKLDAVDALMSTLNDYPPYLWGDALGAAVAALFQSKQDAEEIAQEEKDKAAEG